MTDTKTGFIITYYKSCPEAEVYLENLLNVIGRENYYLVLASHSTVPVHLQEMCDFYFFQELNIVDDRKYSHGVAESNLTEISLVHLLHRGISHTFKVTYDVIIKDVARFEDWKLPGYNFVTCNWGENKICTNSFYADIQWLLDNIKFYRNIEDMMRVHNVLETCWQINIEQAGLMHEVFSFKDKYEFFGPHNKIDNLFYDYNNIDFWYNLEENRFYIKNNGPDLECGLRIFDYYTDLCISIYDEWKQQKDSCIWIVPPDAHHIPSAKNGYYLEIYKNDQVIRKNISIKDFEYKDPFHKKFRFNKDKEVKFNEYCEFEDLGMYKEYGIDINDIENFIDIGACYGFASMPFIKRDIKTYMVEADTGNINILEKAFGNTSKIKIISKAVCDKDGTVDFFISGTVSVVSSLSLDDAGGETRNRIKVTVPAITPNTLIEKHIDENSVDLVKVDIEGAEYDFFNNITDENIKKIKRFIIDFHKNDNFEVLSIIQKLAKNNFNYKLYNWGYYTDPYIIGNKMGIIYAYRQD